MRVKFHAEKAFFKTDTIDPFTGLPIYVFDSNFLPYLNESFDKEQFEMLMVKAFKKIIARIPKHPYVLIAFTSGFKNFNNSNNSWVTCLKCYQILPDELKNFLKKIYIVHESWLVRSMIQVLNNVLRVGFLKTNSFSGEKIDRLIYCNDLTELSKHIDITKIRISLDVYLYDLQFEPRLIIPYSSKKNSKDYKFYKDLIFNRISKRLLIESCDYELVFTKPGNPKRLGILYDAIERGNYLDVSQWDIYVIGSLYLSILRNDFDTLIPIDMIELPISDEYNYTLETFHKIIKTKGNFDVLTKFFEILIKLIENNQWTKHDLKTISKTITPTLCNLKISLKNSDSIAIGQRFIKNLLINWDQIIKDTQEQEPQEQPALASASVIPPTPRKVSFHKRTPSIQREPKILPNIPTQKRNVSSSSTISISSESSEENSINIEPTITSNPIELKKDHKENKVLSDVTKSLNKQPIQPPSITKKPNKVITKFSDGYSSIEGKKKVNQLAKLYEERLMGLEIMKDMK
ncbi:hypothetical protein BN7_6744 [Wickerhamomyces ciferrii]|uniref:Rho-GAP domain-containing protein n=1 Tax=Wickerhamomyces ciferrii (strain ATCC 14091 / BCRC 22168 / CBS 111 / JCM 3599 / NBRC 0793 / NRRL Y-1031 F-60-10) TaxID=1206466 RepID=K0L102_WICCF|nr:uncharacterized protein BN7_6744 [Wickerhamomyces ciferrii]CCH47133.1 hypothetical protein BN7_6744 [Wickerhamomyces ciferrii]